MKWTILLFYVLPAMQWYIEHNKTMNVMTETEIYGKNPMLPMTLTTNSRKGSYKNCCHSFTHTTTLDP